VQEVGFSAEYEELMRTHTNDYIEVNHKRLTEAEFEMFYKDGVFSKISFSNEQVFDFEGLRGRLLSSSYAPMPGEQNYENLMTELKRLFDRYAINGSISFEFVIY
jgi:hypothetical protein